MSIQAPEHIGAIDRIVFNTFDAESTQLYKDALAANAAL